MSAHTPKVVEVFSCSDCARTPATVDEDGCCASCGADCRVVRLVEAAPTDPYAGVATFVHLTSEPFIARCGANKTPIRFTSDGAVATLAAPICNTCVALFLAERDGWRRDCLAAVERFRDARFKALLAIAKARKILRHAHPTSKVTEAYLALDWRNRS